jgi:hypothetical protein
MKQSTGGSDLFFKRQIFVERSLTVQEPLSLVVLMLAGHCKQFSGIIVSTILSFEEKQNAGPRQ